MAYTFKRKIAVMITCVTVGYSVSLADKQVFLAWSDMTNSQSDMTNSLSLELCSAGYRFRATFSKLKMMIVSLVSKSMIIECLFYTVVIIIHEIVIHPTIQIHNDVRGSVTMNASPAMQRLFGKPIHSDF